MLAGLVREFFAVENYRQRKKKSFRGKEVSFGVLTHFVASVVELTPSRKRSPTASHFLFEDKTKNGSKGPQWFKPLTTWRAAGVEKTGVSFVFVNCSNFVEQP